MTNCLLIYVMYGEIFEHFLIYQETFPPKWLCNYSTLNFLIQYMRKIWFSFLSVYPLYSHVIKHGLELTINYLVMTVRNWIVKCFRISKCKNRFFVFQTCCCHRDAKAMIGCKNQRKKLYLHNIYDLRWELCNIKRRNDDKTIKNHFGRRFASLPSNTSFSCHSIVDSFSRDKAVKNNRLQ